MSNVIERVTALAGQKFDSRECRVTNPHITARESIELADHIVALIAERDALAATLSEIQQASQDYSDGKITRYEFVKKLAFLAAVQPQQHLAEIRAEAGRAGFIAGYNECCRQVFGSPAPEYATPHFANQYADKIRQGGDV